MGMKATDLDSKVVVITGAGRGIGLGLARHLAGLGAALVLNDAGVKLNGEPDDSNLIHRVAADIRGAGGKASASANSIADPATADSLVSMAVNEFGRLDAWFNAAVISRDRMIFNMTDEEWSSVIATNLSGTFYSMRATLRHMRQQRSGRVVNLVSTSGLIGNLGQSNYAASKGGIVSLTRVAATEMARYGVTVNCVAPFAHTRMTDSIKGTTAEQQAYLDHARRAKVEHIVPFLAYLASDLSDGINGQVFGARGHEIFLFSQPRPVRVVGRAGGWDLQSIHAAVNASLRDGFTSLQTDLELFQSEPLV
jgi:NAD(P)-dependent dehydrogenase (short-subunit alcohol dehydrogenase family)